MAKKSRRGKKEQPVRLSPAQMVRPGRERIPDTPVAAPAQPEATFSDLQEEYRYVIADLKRIGIIAVAMMTLLVVLALFLT